MDQRFKLHAHKHEDASDTNAHTFLCYQPINGIIKRQRRLRRKPVVLLLIWINYCCSEDLLGPVRWCHTFHKDQPNKIVHQVGSVPLSLRIYKHAQVSITHSWVFILIKAVLRSLASTRRAETKTVKNKRLLLTGNNPCLPKTVIGCEGRIWKPHQQRCYWRFPSSSAYVHVPSCCSRTFTWNTL